MFTHFYATSVRSARFGVKQGVKRPFSPQVIEHFYQDITPPQPIQKDKHDKSAAKTGQNNHSETPCNTAFLQHFTQLSKHPDLNNVNCVKNAILESNFEQLYRYCIENLQLSDNQWR